MRRQLFHPALCCLAAVFALATHSTPARPQVMAQRAVLSRVPPIYPELAKRMRVSGTVTVRATVLPGGAVSEVHTEQGHALLRLAAEQAVRRWRFTAQSNASECLVLVAFDLSQ